MAGDMKAQRGRTIGGGSLRLQHPAIPASAVFEYLVQYEHALFMLPLDRALAGSGAAAAASPFSDVLLNQALWGFREPLMVWQAPIGTSLNDCLS
jgi:hypothetical protein